MPSAEFEAAARAVHEVTGGSIPFGKTRRGKAPSTTVSAAIVANAALEAAHQARGSAVPGAVDLMLYPRLDGTYAVWRAGVGYLDLTEVEELANAMRGHVPGAAQERTR